MGYICKNCRFRLETKGYSDCPYCGKKEIEKEKNATELLEEVESLLSG